MARILSRAERGSSPGFTLVELSITVLILGVVVGLGTLSYTNISRGMALSAAKKQVMAALERAKLSARQENVDYKVVFYPYDHGSYPNTFEFRNRVEGPSGWEERSVNRSVSGEEVIAAGGSYYVKVTQGVQVLSAAEFNFMVRSAEILSYPSEVRLRIGNRTARVTLDALGKISSD